MYLSEKYLSEKEKEYVLSFFPKIKLSYENISHKKIQSDVYIAIPFGVKSFVWITIFNDKNVCFVLELSDNKEQIINIRQIDLCFNSHLAYGTIFYGTLFTHTLHGNLKNLFFTIEDVFYYKGNKIQFSNWKTKFTLFEKIMREDIQQLPITKNFLIIGLPVMNTNIDEFIKNIIDLKYKIKNIQFHDFERNNNFKFISEKLFFSDNNSQNNQFQISHKNQQKNNLNQQLNNQKNNKNQQLNKTNNINQQTNRQTNQKIFKIKPNIQNDIYHLICLNNDNKEHEYDIALISDLKTSMMMNALFRNIKENNNLDLLEESDDEDEFENENIDKFVNLNKVYPMICQYNYKFKKWYPIKLDTSNQNITSLSDISEFLQKK
jgi:hypothetical protein